MNILLVYPGCLEARLHEEDAGVVPIGLYYIGALLKENGYRAEVLNGHGPDGSPDRIRQTLTAFQPDVIGFSIFNANRWGGIEMARMAKDLNPDVKTVFGGVAATFLWDHFLTHFDAIDFTVMGEGEYAFLELVRCIERGDDVASVRGIGFRRGDDIVKTEPAMAIADLDQLPNPARYFTYQHLALTRGCPGKCTFCGSPRFWGPKVRFHSADYFVDQMEMLRDRGVRFFYVSDDTFTLRKDLVMEICQKILERGLNITWAAISRADCVDGEILDRIRRAGCVQISYGVESGSEKMRRFLNKRLSADRIRTAFDLTAQYGIMARAYFIYGCPGETPETIGETIALIREIRPLSAIFYILDVFPGTALYDEFQKRFHVSDDIWLSKIEDILWFEYDPDLDRETILAFGKRLRTAFYESLPGFAASVELKDAPELAPLHADFLSRLAMTFTHGDYAQNDAIPDKEKTGEILCRRALAYHPDHRAFWGLGMLMQQRRQSDAAVRILEQGLVHYPDSEDLNLCMAVSLMNLGRFEQALTYLLRFRDSRQMAYYIIQCYRALGDAENEAAFARRFQGM
ncbi:B12-binding domain-containing radical SAM protei n [Desulfonema ishimotonii]|uniref:B12-binding domain-containing radical SAM protei n n=1 Tax=Desulfonema ishimotonii TaxID=45657 RepID=A0A401G381_9BACT|nr:radical SAM protein [Desulfonema ishimotonii]GBC63575.1 B12-binding domain-containing radical SAM protei n [Desulfonema ishimotonii]